MRAPLDQLRHDVEAARKTFRAQARAILRDAYREAESISTAIGTISVDEAFVGWAHHVKAALSAETDDPVRWDLPPRPRPLERVPREEPPEPDPGDADSDENGNGEEEEDDDAS